MLEKVLGVKTCLCKNWLVKKLVCVEAGYQTILDYIKLDYARLYWTILNAWGWEGWGGTAAKAKSVEGETKTTRCITRTSTKHAGS